MQLTIETAKANTKLPKVIRAAVDLFVEKGVHGTTIREIAERASVSEGALYRHYASKEELACSIFLTHLQQLTDEIEKAVAEARDYRARIQAFVDTCLGAYEDDPGLFTYLIVSEYRELQSLPAGTRHPGHLAMDIIASGQEEGVLRRLDLHAAGSILVGSVVRICAVKMYGGIADDLRSVAPGLGQSLWDALKA